MDTGLPSEAAPAAAFCLCTTGAHGLDHATYVGRYQLDLGSGFDCGEALFISGGPEGWMLWAVNDLQGSSLDGIIEQVASRGSLDLGEEQGVLQTVAGAIPAGPWAAARKLFKVLLRARFHYSMPFAPYGGGLLSAEDLAAEVAGLKAELERTAQAARDAEREAPSPILEVARRFGLNPRPAGQNPEAWWANCPCGGNHSIMVSARANQFGCGYCGRKGGPDELRQFCRDRGRTETRP